MLGSPIIRMVIGLPIAAAVVLGLFAVMDSLIQVDLQCKVGQFIDKQTGQCVEKQNTSLTNILAEQTTIESVRTNRKAATRQDKANKPPPPPKLTASKKNVDLPPAQIQGSAPTEVSFDRVSNIELGSVNVSDRNARPVKQPDQAPVIRAAEKYGKNSKCTAFLDVDNTGTPYNVRVECDFGPYESAVKKSVERAKFAPKVVKGQRVGLKGVVFPFDIGLTDE